MWAFPQNPAGACPGRPAPVAFSKWQQQIELAPAPGRSKEWLAEVPMHRQRRWMRSYLLARNIR